MTELLCYKLDWTSNANAWKRRCEMKDAKKVAKKLIRHFKLGDVRIEFHQGSRGFASRAGHYIRLPKKDCSLGMINHEIAHIRCSKKHGLFVGHGKPHKRQLKIVNAYATRKHYFDKEIDWKLDVPEKTPTLLSPVTQSFLASLI